MSRSVIIALFVAASAAHADPCDDRMTALGERMKALAPYAMTGAMSPEGTATVATAKAIDSGGWWIDVPAKGEARLLYGMPAVTGSLAKQVDAAKMRLSSNELKAREGFPVYFAAHADTPSSRVTAVVKEARAAGLTGEARLLVRLAAPPAAKTDAALFARPGVAKLRETLAKGTEGTAVPLSNAMRAAVQGCEPAIKILSSPRTKVPELTTVPAAAQQCQCKMSDVDVFEYVLLTYVRAYDFREGWLPIK